MEIDGRYQQELEALDRTATDVERAFLPNNATALSVLYRYLGISDYCAQMPKGEVRVSWSEEHVCAEYVDVDDREAMVRIVNGDIHARDDDFENARKGTSILRVHASSVALFYEYGDVLDQLAAGDALKVYGDLNSFDNLPALAISASTLDLADHPEIIDRLEDYTHSPQPVIQITLGDSLGQQDYVIAVVRNRGYEFPMVASSQNLNKWEDFPHLGVRILLSDMGLATPV
jgi:hypothetical protein